MRKTADPISRGVENGRLHFGAEALGIASPLEMSSLVAERTGEPPMGTGGPATEGGADQGTTLTLQLGSEEEGPPPEPSQAGRCKERLGLAQSRL